MGHEYYILKDEFYLHQPKIITNDVKNVLIAGMDGYGRKNTYSSEMLKTDISENEIQQLNEEIQSMLDESQTSSNMVHIQFITNSIYKARR